MSNPYHIRNYEDALKKDGMRLKLVHLHEGNSSKRQRHGRKFVTVALIIDDRGFVEAEGYAECSKQDNPRRKIGREIAIGRALKSYYGGE